MTDLAAEIIVVGAGLAGLAAAWELAGAGHEVLVVERGAAAGAKNLTGGRLYLEPVRALAGDLLDGAPFERPVTSESLCLMGPSASTTVSFTGERLRAQPPHSVTVLRSKLDRHLADKLGERGAFVVPDTRVDAILVEGGRAVGVRTGDEELRSRAVVLAEGALGLLGRELGLAGPHEPAALALGIKEVLSLDPGRIEDRFALEPGQGAARLFFGDLTAGMAGGGFLYTNTDTLSLGVVVVLDGLAAASAESTPSHALLDALKARPELRPLLAGAETVEYGAHAVPEGGHLPRRSLPGLLVVGDAAGFALNLGITVRGMDLAIASGVFAARALEAELADESGATSAAEHYDRALAESFVLRDLHTFRAAPGILGDPSLSTTYPAALAGLLEQWFWVGDGPKAPLAPSAWAAAREVGLGRLASDLWRLRRM